MTSGSETELIHDVVREHAARRGQHRMLVSGETVLTYAEADRLVDVLGGGLTEMGLRPGDRLLVMMPAGIDYVLLWLACSRFGIVLVAVNENLRGEMLRHQVLLADAKAFVAAAEQLGNVASVVAPAERPATAVLVGEAGAESVDGWGRVHSLRELMEKGPTTVAPPRVTVRDAMGIYFTSGTTGPSKGVLYAHGQALATARPMAEAYHDDEVFYFFYPMYHVSVPHMIGSVLLRGGTVVLRERFSGSEFWADIRRYGITVTMMLGSIASFIEAMPASPDDRNHGLRRVLMVPLVQHPAGFCERFGVEIMTWFNMTEVALPIHSGGFGIPADASCGKARPGIDLRVVDENDNPVRTGETGELVIRADRPWELNLGYWRQPDKTVESWRNLWFHTGDAFRQGEDGSFYFIDRMKDSIRRRGENISSYEIEREVGSHPAVLECAAVAVPALHGEDEVKIVVTLRSGASLEEEELLAHLRPRMAAYMLPRYVQIAATELPKTPTGKVRKAVLREDGTSGAWDREAHKK